MLNPRPVHLYFGNISELKITEDIFKKVENMTHRIVMCKTWNDLPNLLKTNFVQGICFNYTELENISAVELVNLVRTFSKLVNLDYDIPIAIDIGLDAHIDIVKMAQKSGIQGVIPRSCDFTWEECEKGTIALWAKIPYWPKHILDKLPGSVVKNNKPNEIKLTARQKQIYSLVSTRGASNKVIAKTLNISESTVKLHVSAILKKYGVRNRTQLAVFAAQHET